MENKTPEQQNNSGTNPNLKPILIFVVVFAVAFFGTRVLMGYLK